MNDELIITIDDIRKTGLCVRGTKEWFERNGLDFRDFMENGCLPEALLATGDANAIFVVEQARRRKGEKNG